MESTRKDKAFFLNLAERAVFKLCGKDEESGGGVEGTRAPGGGKHTPFTVNPDATLPAAVRLGTLDRKS